MSPLRVTHKISKGKPTTWPKTDQECGLNLDDLLAEMLELPVKLVRIIMVNNKQKKMDKILSDGDFLYIFPPIISG